MSQQSFWDASHNLFHTWQYWKSDHNYTNGSPFVCVLVCVYISPLNIMGCGCTRQRRQIVPRESITDPPFLSRGRQYRSKNNDDVLSKLFNRARLNMSNCNILVAPVCKNTNVIFLLIQHNFKILVCLSNFVKSCVHSSGRWTNTYYIIGIESSPDLQRILA